MPTDRNGAPWPGATYNGFSDAPSGGGSAPPNEPEPKPVRRPTRNLLLGGVAAAVGLGLAFGLLAKPDFGEDGRAREPMRVATAGTTAPVEPVPASQFEIEVNKPVLDPVPASTGKLEVLPPDLAQEAARQAAASQPVRVAIAPPAVPPRPVPVDRTEAPRQVFIPAPTQPPAQRYASAPQSQVRPSFDCRYARSPSERMVCGDSELALADRRLNQAYNRAIAAGIPARELRAEQDDWLSIRDDAARHSSDAVASVYEQRIGELNELAEEPY
jgi:uncharacterized protein YecT (DUF1311 family)